MGSSKKGHTVLKPMAFSRAWKSSDSTRVTALVNDLFNCSLVKASNSAAVLFVHSLHSAVSPYDKAIPKSSVKPKRYNDTPGCSPMTGKPMPLCPAHL